MNESNELEMHKRNMKQINDNKITSTIDYIDFFFQIIGKFYFEMQKYKRKKK